jgi:MraZ protein
MALTGTYQRALDEKRRLPVPKKLKDEFGSEAFDSLYISPGTHRSLSLYSPLGFQRLADRLAAKANHESYLRVFYASSEKVELDGQGRIRIPDRLMEYAGLDKEVVLLGVHDHAELWDSKVWDEFNRQVTAEFDALAQAAFKG